MSISVISDCVAMVEGEPLARLPHVGVELEGDFGGRFRLGRVGAIAKHAELPRDDFGAEPLPASVLGFVLAGGQPAFDVNLTALAQKLLAGIRDPPEGHDPMPFGAFLLVAVSVRKPLLGRHREIRHSAPDLGRVRTCGLAPRLPITIALLIAIAVTSILFGLLHPLPVIGQGVLRCFHHRATFFRAALTTELEGRAQIPRCASAAGGRPCQSAAARRAGAAC